jgi:hypothetical protein
LWNHWYFTETQKNERSEKKKENEEMLKGMIKEEWKTVIIANY